MLNLVKTQKVTDFDRSLTHRQTDFEKDFLSFQLRLGTQNRHSRSRQNHHCFRTKRRCGMWCIHSNRLFRPFRSARHMAQFVGSIRDLRRVGNCTQIHLHNSNPQHRRKNHCHLSHWSRNSMRAHRCILVLQVHHKSRRCPHH